MVDGDFAEPGKKIITSWEIIGDLPKDISIDDLALSLSFPETFSITDNNDPEIVNSGKSLEINYKEKGKLEWLLESEASGPFSFDLFLIYKQEIIAMTSLELEEGFTQELTQKGGELDYKNGNVKLTFPEGSLSEDITLKYKRLSLGKEGIPYVLSGNMFEVEAYGKSNLQEISNFDKELSIEIKYDHEMITGDESTLTLFYFNETENDWYPLPSEVDIENHILKGYTNHFTVFDFNTQDFQAATLPTLKSFQAGGSTGAASFSYSIEIPPGPGGLQPSISLSYNSQSVDGMTNRTQSSWVGAGWSLNTGGYITRNMNGTPGYWGNDDNYPPDGDQGDDGDDTFSLILNGQSWQLLRMPGSDPFLIDYRTTDESFLKIQRHHIFDVNNSLYAHRSDPDGYWADWSWWEVWDKQGNIYYFGSKPDGNNAQDHYKQARFCSKCGYNPNPYVESPLADTWKWGLSEVHTPYTADNPDYKLTYSYTFETGAGKLPDCNLTQSAIDYAMYPDTIMYANGRYRVRFVKTSREDYQYSWQDPNLAMLFEKSLLSEIIIEYKNDSNQWQQVRKYVLTYAFNEVFPNVKWSTYWGQDPAGNRTPTLMSIQQYNNDNSSTLPATTFDYDNMHMSSVTNGYGGQVSFTYDTWHELTSDETPIGWWGGTTATGIVNIGTPAELFTPGQYNRMLITLQSYDGVQDIKFGMKYTLNNETTYTYAGEVKLLSTNPGGQPGSTNYQYEGYVLIPATANQAQFFHECSIRTCKNIELLVYSVVTRYRVTSKVESTTDYATPIATYYRYDDPATNDIAHSTGASASEPYVKKLTQWRGNGSTQQRDASGLMTTTWFYQDDLKTGKSFLSLQGKFSWGTDFNNLNLSYWTQGLSSGSQTLKRLEGDPALEMINPNTNDNNSIYREESTIEAGTATNAMLIQFKVSSPVNSFKLGLEGNDKQWAIHVYDGDIGTVYTNNDGQYVEGPILLSSYSADAWYVLLIIADNNGNYIRIWNRDDPAVMTEFRQSISAHQGTLWKMKAVVNGGTAWLDTYTEGIVYSINESAYAICDLDTVVTNPPADCPAVQTYKMPKRAGYYTYNDIYPSWVRLDSATSLIYNGDADYESTKTVYAYTISLQGNVQYGNSTEVTEYALSTSYLAYRRTRTEYYPYTSTDRYLTGLPGRTYTWSCNDNNSCPYSGELRTNNQWFLYDGATNYSTPPSAGILTRARKSVRFVSPNNYFADELYTYDSWGNRLTVTTYSGEGVNSTFASAGEQITTSTYDSPYHTYLEGTEDAAGHTTAMTYDYRMSVPLSMTDNNSQKTYATYDTFGRLSSICRPEDFETGNPDICRPMYTVPPPSGQINPTNTVSYHEETNLFWTEATQKLGQQKYFRVRKFYNGMGQLIQTQQVGLTLSDSGCTGTNCASIVDYYYDASGNLEYQSMPYAMVTPDGYTDRNTSKPRIHTQYDWFGRTSLVTSPDGSQVTTVYQDLTQTTTDARNYPTTNTYEVWGNLKTVTPAAGPGVTYQYDIANHLTGAYYGPGEPELPLEKGDPNVTSIKYDLGGRKTEMTDPDMGTWSYEYDALGNMTKQQDAKGQVTCLYYDALNRLTIKNYQSNGSCAANPSTPYRVQYTYDDIAVHNFMFGAQQINITNIGKNRRTGMIVKDAGGTVISSSDWIYDNRGRTLYEIMKIDPVTSNTYITGWTYNSADLPITMTYPDHTVVTTTYLPQMTVNTMMSTSPYLPYVTGTSYDSSGRVVSRNLNNGNFAQSFQYNSWITTGQGGRLYKATYGTPTDDDFYNDLYYHYLANGSIDLINDDPTSPTWEWYYDYDAANRLTYSCMRNSNHECYSDKIEVNSYDDSTGNLDIKGALDLNYSPTTQPHAATKLGITPTYTYDANGNQVTRIVDNVSYTLTYDAENRLTGISGTDLTASYVYDGDGNRVKTVVNGVITHYIGNYYEVKNPGAGQTYKKYYYAGGARVAMNDNGDVRYFITDHLGSTTKMINANGNKYPDDNNFEIKYASWGSDQPGTPNLGTTFKYTGQRQAEAGLYYYNARWYDPKLGRFIQADTIIPDPGNPLAWDRYAYGFNNPVNSIDPTGHKPCGEYCDSQELEPGYIPSLTTVQVDSGQKGSTTTFDSKKFANSIQKNNSPEDLRRLAKNWDLAALGLDSLAELIVLISVLGGAGVGTIFEGNPVSGLPSGGVAGWILAESSGLVQGLVFLGNVAATISSVDSILADMKTGDSYLGFTITQSRNSINVSGSLSVDSSTMISGGTAIAGWIGRVVEVSLMIDTAAVLNDNNVIPSFNRSGDFNFTINY
jgi:RHS repeat-associated protein